MTTTDSVRNLDKGGNPDANPDALYAGSSASFVLHDPLNHACTDSTFCLALALQFMELIASPRWEDWKFTSTYRNRFSFLGNGIGTVSTSVINCWSNNWLSGQQIEAKEGDRAYYLKYEDHLNPIHGDVKSNGVSKSLHKSDGAEKIDALASDAPAPLRFF